MKNKKDIEKVLLGIAGGEDITFEVVNDNPTFVERLLHIKKRAFTVRQFTTLNDNIKITQILTSIPEFKVDKKGDAEKVIFTTKFIAKHSEKIIDIVMIILKTSRRKYLVRNLMNKDVLQIFIQVFAMIDFQSFTTSTTLIQNNVGLKS